MRIYLATAAPGTEGNHRMLKIRLRLLSYHHIVSKQFNCHDILNHIIKKNRRKKDED